MSLLCRRGEFLSSPARPSHHQGLWLFEEPLFHKLPIEKRTADLQWRIIHGAIATNMHLVHLDPTVGEGCLFCAESNSGSLGTAYYKLVNNIDLFMSIWGIQSLFCIVSVEADLVMCNYGFV